MEYYNKKDLEHLDKEHLKNITRGIVGFNSTHLLGTKDSDGKARLHLSNRVIHLSSIPALIGIVLSSKDQEKGSLNHILNTSYFTINHVHAGMCEKAHFATLNFPNQQSEFDACGLSANYLNAFAAPYVLESKIKFGLKLKDVVELSSTNTQMLIGEIEHIHIANGLSQKNCQLILDKAFSVGSADLISYHGAKHIATYPKAQLDEVPEHLSMKEKRSDQVVYDEESQSYNASLLPYATDAGAPAIVPQDLTLWKNNGANKISNHLKARYDEIRAQYDDMKELYKWNEMVYQAKFSFEPVLGETYHLYRDKDAQLFLSMIPPDTWKREHLGSFQLNSDQIWQKLD